MQIRQFDEKMGKQERIEVLKDLRNKILENKQFSEMKKSLLLLVLNYADESLTGFMTIHLDKNRFIEIKNIFAMTNLRDNDFLHYIVNQLAAIGDFSSRFKTMVLPTAMNYLREQVINTFEFSDRKKNILLQILMCADECYRFVAIKNKIFSMTDLDDIHFMQYVVNELSAIECPVSKLKTWVHSKALEERDTLLNPRIQMIRKVFFTGALCALYSGDVKLVLGILLGSLFAHSIAERCLQNTLEKIISDRELQGLVPQIGDGLDAVLTNASNISERLLNAGASRLLLLGNRVATHLERQVHEEMKQQPALLDSSMKHLPGAPGGPKLS